MTHDPIREAKSVIIGLWMQSASLPDVDRSLRRHGISANRQFVMSVVKSYIDAQTENNGYCDEVYEKVCNKVSSRGGTR